MALSVRSVSSATSITTDPIVVSKPSGVVDGDLLLVVIYLEDNTTTVVTAPSGWSPIPAAGSLLSNTTGPFRAYCYGKRASGEGANWSWDMSAAPLESWGCIAISGNTGTGAFVDTQATAVDTASNATTAAATVTTTQANDMIVVLDAHFDFGSTYSSGGSVASSEQLDVAGICIYTGIKAAAGSTGTQTLTRSASSGDNSYTVALLETDAGGVSAALALREWPSAHFGPF